MRARHLGAWLLVPLFAVTTVGAANDGRLTQAVKKSDKAAVRTLLQQRVDVNAAQPDGSTALLLAAQQGNLDIVQELLRACANVKAANRYGATALTAACINGDAPMIEALIKAGADPNSALPEGETALMTAARTGSVAAVKALLAHGATVNGKESWRGQTALMWAAAENHADAVKVLTEVGAEVNARSNGGFTALLFASRGGSLDAVKALIAAGANVNDTVQGPQRGGGMAAAAGAAAPGATQRIYGRSVDPNAPAGANVAPAAAGNGQNTNNPTAATTGIRGGNAGPSGTSALVLAVMNANFEVAVALLDAGADSNADGQGWTALHQLAWTRRPPIQHGLPNAVTTGKIDSLTLAKALLAHGANPNARQKREPADGARNMLDRLGSTPFLAAAKLGDHEYMRILVAGGADPSLKTDENTTAMMAAAGLGIWHTGESAGSNEDALAAVKICFELGNDVNAVNDNGDTALHGAALRGAPEVVKFLVSKGAKMDVRNTIGWTPLTISEGVMYPNTFNRQLEVAEVLHTLGAKDGGQRRPEDLPPADVFDAVQKAASEKEKK